MARINKKGSAKAPTEACDIVFFPPHHGSCFPNRQRRQLSESMAIQSVLKTQRYKNTDAPDTTNHPAQAGGAGYWEHSWSSYFSLFCQGRLCFCFKFRPLVIQWGFQERYDSISQLKAGKTESWKRYKCLVIYGEYECEYQYQSAAPGL